MNETNLQRAEHCVTGAEARVARQEVLVEHMERTRDPELALTRAILFEFDADLVIARRYLAFERRMASGRP